MEKKLPENDRPAWSPHELPDETFPQTRTRILAAAAAGQWQEFADAYLRPCWREVVLECRRHGASLPDADDLFQELWLRLLKTGALQVEEVLGEEGAFRGNLPARFLEHRRRLGRTARFRTYLKQVLAHLLWERHRAQGRTEALADQPPGAEPWIEQSLSCALDRQLVAASLQLAAEQLRDECSLTTKGRSRWFELLVRSTSHGESPGKLAHEWGVDRTTISSQLAQARGRFAEILCELTGLTEAELPSLIDVTALQDTLAKVATERSTKD